MFIRCLTAISIFTLNLINCENVEKSKSARNDGIRVLSFGVLSLLKNLYHHNFI